MVDRSRLLPFPADASDDKDVKAPVVKLVRVRPEGWIYHMSHAGLEMLRAVRKDAAIGYFTSLQEAESFLRGDNAGTGHRDDGL
jgi:hypothetical protein